MLDDCLALATRRRAEVELQLVGKGIPPGTAQRGCARAWGEAEFHTRQIQTPNVRCAAFLEVLNAELARAEVWCWKQLAYFDITPSSLDNGAPSR